jgi:hypothetical protein
LPGFFGVPSVEGRFVMVGRWLVRNAIGVAAAQLLVVVKLSMAVQLLPMMPALRFRAEDSAVSSPGPTFGRRMSCDPFPRLDCCG